MSWRLAYWLVFAASLAVYATMLIWTLPEIAEGAGGLVPFDMRPGGYSADEARTFLAALSDDGRALYLGPQHTLDLVYPALLAIVLIGAIHALIPVRIVMIGLSIAVLIGTAGDYAENYFVRELLNHEGVVSDDMVASANRATLVKSVMTTIGMFGVVGGLGRVAWKKWMAR